MRRNETITISEWPHEYIVRERVDNERFIQLVRHIRTHGYKGKFYEKEITYFDEDEMVYWTMGDPLEKTIIVNRCKKENSYQYRLIKDTLPGWQDQKRIFKKNFPRQ